MKKEEQSYKAALAEIEEIIGKLESGETDIDEMAKEVKRASKLIQQCRSKLYSVEKQIDKALDIE